MSINHNIIILDKVGSTNSHAEQLLSNQKPPEGTVIFTLNQTAGKGLGSNTWESEPGKNLTFSIILYPVFLHPSRQFMLNKAISLGVLDYMKIILPGHDCTLKWPNDIYAGNKKIGGILIRHVIAGEEISSTVAGIGININQEIFNPSIPNPVSVKQLLHRELDPVNELHHFLSYFDERYRQLRSGDHASLDEDYDHNLLGYGAWRKYVSPDLCFDGKIKGVNDSGQLIMETKKGDSLFNHGEVEFVL